MELFELAIIPARGGSKGLPGKNTRPLCGRPMIAWTIDAALKSGCFKRVVVSTDDPQIAHEARIAGAEVPFMRPEELATDTATSMDVVLHALSHFDFPGNFALLQPTSPLRDEWHIKEAIGEFFDSGSGALISVTISKPVSWLMELDSERKLHRLLRDEIAPRRQASIVSYVPNGAMYLFDTLEFLNEKKFIPEGSAAYEMSSIDSLDIDTLEDFQLVEAIIKAGMRPRYMNKDGIDF